MKLHKAAIRLAAILAVAAFTSVTLFAQNGPRLTDPEIASIAVTANQIDVNYGKNALAKLHNPEVKHFAETMIKDHEAIIKQAVELATRLGVVPKDNPTTQSLLKGEKETNAKLAKLTGAAFEKAYIDNEVAFHEAVIATVKDVLIPQTDNAELKAFLVKASPLLNHHLEMAKMAQKKVK